jgi:RimJ/RimL family protein N-acetyltransferase
VTTDLTTSRLLLRPFRLKDWPAIHAYASDPAATRYVPFGPNTTDETIEFVEQSVAEWAKPVMSAFRFVITLRDSGEVIGACNITRIPEQDDQATVGYFLNPQRWGNGYATEAVEALIGFGFETAQLAKLIAWCDAENVASWRVMEKSGMRRMRLETRAKYIKDRWWDVLWYEITRSEWERKQPRPDAAP